MLCTVGEGGFGYRIKQSERLHHSSSSLENITCRRETRPPWTVGGALTSSTPPIECWGFHLAVCTWHSALLLLLCVSLGSMPRTNWAASL